MNGGAIDRIRDSVSIVELAGGLVELKGSGAKFLGICPFHADTDASLVVYSDQNSWHCYGCKRGGSAFDWVMERDKCEFLDAAVTLSNLSGIPLTLTDEEREHYDIAQAAYSILSQYVDKAHERLLKDRDTLDYLHTEGITDESIREYRIGLGFKVAEDKLTEPMHHAAIVHQTERGLWQPMAGRILFPVIRGGKVVQVSCRKLPGSTSSKKYISLPDTLAIRGLTPFNAHRLRGDRCILVEGAKDAILLEQAGFPACATISSAFKAEWKSLLRDKTHYLCCYDADENEAGQQANEQIANLIHTAGFKVSLISLPVPSDPAEFIQAEGAGGFQSLVDQAETLVGHLIGKLPEKVSEHEYDTCIKPIFKCMVTLPETAKEAYLGRIAKLIGAGKPALRADLQKFSRNGSARPDTEDDEHGSIRWRATDPIWFNPAQDLIDNTLYYTIHLQAATGAFLPHVISSKREVFPLCASALQDRDFVLKCALPQSNASRWSIGTDEPHNVREYLDGKTDIDPKALYLNVRKYFEKYLRLPDPFYYDFLVLWTMATYHFRAYDAFGYVFLHAIKGSGKTQTMNLINMLAFNAKQADAITEASLKRAVAADASTLLYDEAEKLWRKFEKDESSFQEVIKGGYTKSGMAMSVNKDTHANEEFPTYSPKVFANTKGLDDTMADRCITLQLQRDVGVIPQFVEAEQSQGLKVLRNMIYCFTLQYVDGIMEVKQSLERPEGLSGRDWQLWQAVFVLAKFLDGFGVVGDTTFLLDSGDTATLAGLYDRMVTMSLERKQDKMDEEEERNPEYRIMMTIWNYICEHPANDDFYPGAELRKAIIDETGWEKFSNEQLSAMIFKKLHIAISRQTDKTKRRILGTAGGPQWHYRLDKSLIISRAAKFFGKELVVPSVPG